MGGVRDSSSLKRMAGWPSDSCPLMLRSARIRWCRAAKSCAVSLELDWEMRWDQMRPHETSNTTLTDSDQLWWYNHSVHSYRYEEDFDALFLCVHGCYSETLLTDFIHLHVRPKLSVEDHSKTSLSPHDCKQKQTQRSAMSKQKHFRILFLNKLHPVPSKMLHALFC